MIKDHPREVSIVTSEDAQSALYALLTTRYGIAQPGAAATPPSATPAASAATAGGPTAASGAGAGAGATTQAAAPAGAAAPSPATANGGAVANGNSSAQVLFCCCVFAPVRAGGSLIFLGLRCSCDTAAIHSQYYPNNEVSNLFFSLVGPVLTHDVIGHLLRVFIPFYCICLLCYRVLRLLHLPLVAPRRWRWTPPLRALARPVRAARYVCFRLPTDDFGVCIYKCLRG